MQFRVPQNIDLEDKIVGPLTLKQFIVCVIGGSIDYILFKELTDAKKMGLFIIIGGPIALVTVMFAFVKIQERPFWDFFISLISYSFRPQKRIYVREGYNPDEVIKETNGQKAEAKNIIKKAPSSKDLQSLSSILDSDKK